jgi:ATP-dependent DNA helicase RecG
LKSNNDLLLRQKQTSMINLQKIVQAGEGLHSEFKTSFKEDVIETLVAFPNAKGGAVYIGISDKGSISGVTIGK